MWDLPGPGIELMSPALADGSWPLDHQGSPLLLMNYDTCSRGSLNGLRLSAALSQNPRSSVSFGACFIYLMTQQAHPCPAAVSTVMLAGSDQGGWDARVGHGGAWGHWKDWHSRSPCHPASGTALGFWSGDHCTIFLIVQ